ncbi:MAG: malonyl-ACP O-methyltransferase BioC [Gammaproteobacteria bacterium]|nr:malonyl-ACP O-methyltransferase BioC [Gammaproteobacteria bacterium]
MNADQPEVLDRRIVARDFDTAAATYERVAVLQHTVLERLLERLDVIRLQPRVILDLGSGSGSAARRLARRYRHARLLQLDIAYGMLRQARAQSWRWFSRQRFIQADALALPLAAGSTDFVFSNLMLQWVDRPEQVFTELHRCLRPGGLVQFASFGPDTLQELRASWAAVDEAPHVSPFVDMHNVGDALVRAGFADPVMEAEHFCLTYPDCYALMRELQQLGARNALAARRRTLTGHRRLRGMVAAYEQFRQPDGRLPATFEVVYGHAWVPAQPQQTADPDSGEVHVPLTALKRRRE